MRTPSSPGLILALYAAAASACIAEQSEPQPSEQGLTTCVVDTPSNVVELEATPDGLVVASGSDVDVTVQRLLGTGCDLVADGVPVAAESLLDVDDHGNLYVFPSETYGRCLRSSMPPGEYRGIVAVVPERGNPTKLVDGGRGIWSFGVSPSGDALWVTACGPTGVFAIGPDGLTESMTPLGLLTDARTSWSIGASTCPSTEPVTADCGYELVRSTPEATVELGSTLVDHGDGLVHAELARCGSNVCGVYPRAVTLWDASGMERLTVTLADLGATELERIVAATGNDAGIYVLLNGDVVPRVVFVATSPSARVH